MLKELVAIIHSTYDGQKSPAEQLDSLLAQDDMDVALLIMGDGARGSDLSILRCFASHHENIQWIAGDNRPGVAGSFPIALKHAENPTELPRIPPIWTTSESPASIANAMEALSAERDRDLPLLYDQSARNLVISTESVRDFLMDEWWCYLAVSAFGQVVVDDRSEWNAGGTETN